LPGGCFIGGHCFVAGALLAIFGPPGTAGSGSQIVTPALSVALILALELLLERYGRSEFAGWSVLDFASNLLSSYPITDRI